MKAVLRVAQACFLVGLFAAAPTRALGGIVVLSTEHVDVDIAFKAGKFELGVHDETNDVEYAANQALLFVTPAAQTVQPANPAFNFIGAGAGNPVWVLSQVQNPLTLLLGTDTEEIPDGTFQGDTLTLSLIDVRGPGFFSVWATDAFGNPIVQMATSNGISPADRMILSTNTHNDWNWGFTAVGFYEVDFQATAVLPGGATVASEVTTYFFAVGTAVPEPGSTALVGLGAVGLLVALARRWKGGRENAGHTTKV
jgi:surface-anchored protein